MTQKLLSGLMAAVMAMAMVSGASAQQGKQERLLGTGGAPQQYVAPKQGCSKPQALVVDPGYVGMPTPKLGFQGQMLYGFGMKVLYVNYGSVAQKIGLEPGDVIVRIDGRKVNSKYDYDQALRDCVMYRGGRCKLLVKNIRYSWGTSPREYVQVHAYLDTYVGPAVAAAQAGQTFDN